MSWARAKRVNWKKQGGLCEYCNQPMSWRNAVCHHRLNRKDGGTDDPSNGAVRHRFCERKCHRLYADGNVPKGVRREELGF